MASAGDGRSITELFADAINQLGKLVRTEIQLAKAEVGAKAAQAAIGAGMIAGAGIVAMAALVVLLLALAAFLAEMGLSDSFANLIAAVVGFALAGIMVMVGKNRLKPENLTPQRTMEQLELDARAVKETVR